MNKFILGIFLIVVAVSCDKSLVPYDHEEGMEKGNTTLLKSVTLIDTFSTYLTARAEFVLFNELESQSTFDQEVVNDLLIYDTQSEITTTSSFAPTAFKNYNNLILVNTDNRVWMDYFSPGYYLDRYFHQLELQGGSSAGICQLGKEVNYEPQFYVENSGDVFGNSADYNTTAFYDVAGHQEGSSQGYIDSNEIELKPFLEGLDKVLDEIIPYTSPTEDLVITCFMHGVYGFEAGTEDLFTTIWQKCWDNNIRINIISLVYGIYDMELAMHTGGFYHIAGGCFDLGTNQYQPCDPNQRVSTTGVLLQNLHDLLIGRYSSHVIDFNLSMPDVATFQSRQIIFGGLEYNGFTYPLTVNKHQ